MEPLAVMQGSTRRRSSAPVTDSPRASMCHPRRVSAPQVSPLRPHKEDAIPEAQEEGLTAHRPSQPGFPDRISREDMEGGVFHDADDANDADFDTAADDDTADDDEEDDDEEEGDGSEPRRIRGRRVSQNSFAIQEMSKTLANIYTRRSVQMDNKRPRQKSVDWQRRLVNLSESGSTSSLCSDDGLDEQVVARVNKRRSRGLSLSKQVQKFELPLQPDSGARKARRSRGHSLSASQACMAEGGAEASSKLVSKLKPVAEATGIEEPATSQESQDSKEPEVIPNAERAQKSEAQQTEDPEENEELTNAKGVSLEVVIAQIQLDEADPETSSFLDPTIVLDDDEEGPNNELSSFTFIKQVSLKKADGSKAQKETASSQSGSSSSTTVEGSDVVVQLLETTPVIEDKTPQAGDTNAQQQKEIEQDGCPSMASEEGKDPSSEIVPTNPLPSPQVATKEQLGTHEAPSTAESSQKNEQDSESRSAIPTAPKEQANPSTPKPNPPQALEDALEILGAELEEETPRAPEPNKQVTPDRRSSRRKGDDPMAQIRARVKEKLRKRTQSNVAELALTGRSKSNGVDLGAVVRHDDERMRGRSKSVGSELAAAARRAKNKQKGAAIAGVAEPTSLML